MKRIIKDWLKAKLRNEIINEYLEGIIYGDRAIKIRHIYEGEDGIYEIEAKKI